MKKIFLAMIATLFASTGHADDHMRAPTMGAIETFACNFADGKDMDDFVRVAAKWDDFADDAFSAPYQGFVLTSYYSADMEHDLYWVGFSPNFTAQGKTAQEWMEKGAALQAEFDAAAPCDAHSQFGYFPIYSSGTPTPATGVVDFSGCSVKDGVSQQAIAAADAKMNAFIAELGINVTIGRWFPMHGTDFAGDFIQASRFDSLAEKGEVYDKFIQAGGPQTQMALYGDLMICRDGPTSLYNAAGGSTGG